MNSLASLYALLCSPVAVLELRARMRGWRMPLYCASAVMVSTAVLFFLLAMQGYGLTGSVREYRLIFVILICSLSVLLSLLTLILAAGTFTPERERQSFEALALTTLPDRDLVIGKLIALLCFVLIVLVSSLPVIAFAAVLGGYTVTDIVQALLFMLLSLSASAAIGISASLQTAETSNAVMTSLGSGMGMVYFCIAIIWVAQLTGKQPLQSIICALGILLVAHWLTAREQSFRMAGLRELILGKQYRQRFLQNAFWVFFLSVWVIVYFNHPAGFSREMIIAHPVIFIPMSLHHPEWCLTPWYVLWNLSLLAYFSYIATLQVGNIRRHAGEPLPDNRKNLQKIWEALSKR